MLTGRPSGDEVASMAALPVCSHIHLSPVNYPAAASSCHPTRSKPSTPRDHPAGPRARSRSSWPGSARPGTWPRAGRSATASPDMSSTRQAAAGSGRPPPEVLVAVHQTWLRDPATGNYLLDVFREPHDGDTWTCRHDERSGFPTAGPVPRLRPAAAGRRARSRLRDPEQRDLPKRQVRPVVHRHRQHPIRQRQAPPPVGTGLLPTQTGHDPPELAEHPRRQAREQRHPLRPARTDHLLHTRIIDLGVALLRDSLQPATEVNRRSGGDAHPVPPTPFCRRGSGVEHPTPGSPRSRVASPAHPHASTREGAAPARRDRRR
jgi:hypothetical protein